MCESTNGTAKHSEITCHSIDHMYICRHVHMSICAMYTCVHACRVSDTACMACTHINIDVYAHVHINMNVALVLYCLIILYNTAEDYCIIPVTIRHIMFRQGLG